MWPATQHHKAESFPQSQPQQARLDAIAVKQRTATALRAHSDTLAACTIKAGKHQPRANQPPFSSVAHGLIHTKRLLAHNSRYTLSTGSKSEIDAKE